MRGFVDFIKKIQESDEQTKRFWLYIFTGILTGVIVLVWISGFKTFFPVVDLGPQNQKRAEAGKDLSNGNKGSLSEKTNAAKTFMAGLEAILGDAKAKAKEKVLVEIAPEKYKYEALQEDQRINQKFFKISPSR